MATMNPTLFDVEEFTNALADHVAELPGTNDVVDAEENMRGGGYWFEFLGPDNKTYVVLVNERGA